MRSPRWYPEGTRRETDPEPGQVLAHRHAAWRVISVQEVDLTAEEGQEWLACGLPDLGRHYRRPYRIVLEWIGGAEPGGLHEWVAQVDGRQQVAFRITANRYRPWNVYPDGRWLQCPCCGEPIPCRRELRDRLVEASAAELTRLMAIPEGACWGCAETITPRQKWIGYPGDNVDLPGGPEARFHTRRQCRTQLLAYEERWLAVDPRRERVYTWPKCDGMLTTHGDGTSECGQGPVWPHAGISGDPHPDCGGHLTHDHGNRQACHDEGCPHGCGPETYIRLTPRPERRPQRDEPAR